MNEASDEELLKAYQLATDDRFEEYLPEGLRAIYDRGKRDAAPRWVPVGERLPEHGAHVLCFHPDWGVGTGLSIRGGELNEVVGDWAGGDVATHWMPLPEPPEWPTDGQ